jgi:hypothetical protein
MRYAVWDDGGLYHARNLDNIRTAEDFNSIPEAAVMVTAESGRHAIELMNKSK